MTYTDDILDKVKSFGVLGYSVDKIMDLICPSSPEAFREAFCVNGHPLWVAYRKGKTTGGYNLDKELFDESIKRHSVVANNMLHKRMAQNKLNDTIYEEFGL